MKLLTAIHNLYLLTFKH